MSREASGEICPRHTPVFGKHRPIHEHPENPGRLNRVLKALGDLGLQATEYPSQELHPKPLTLAQMVHDEQHINRVLTAAQRAPTMLDSDTYVSKGSLEAALTALAYAYNAARLHIEDGACRVEFLLPRPPGHHAGRRGAALGAPSLGFCLFNNIAVAAETLARELGGGVLVVDFDVHHGNGTQDIFYRDPRVLHVDVHQDPSTLYPGTGWPWDRGEGPGKESKLNLVLPPHSGDDVFSDAVEKGLEWARGRLGREGVSAILVSAGFDAYQNDGLAWTRVTADGFRRAGDALRRLSEETGLPLLVFLEGGYSTGLDRGVKGFLLGLKGVGQGIDQPTRSPRSVWNRYVEWRQTALESP